MGSKQLQDVSHEWLPICSLSCYFAAVGRTKIGMKLLTLRSIRSLEAGQRRVDGKTSILGVCKWAKIICVLTGYCLRLWRQNVLSCIVKVLSKCKTLTKFAFNCLLFCGSQFCSAPTNHLLYVCISQHTC